jgi:hypothetical protein
MIPSEGSGGQGQWCTSAVNREGTSVSVSQRGRSPTKLTMSLTFPMEQEARVCFHVEQGLQQKGGLAMRIDANNNAASAWT